MVADTVVYDYGFGIWLNFRIHGQLQPAIGSIPRGKITITFRKAIILHLQLR